MTVLAAQLLVDCKNQLGECVLWNAREERVYWTDVYGCRLHSCDANGSEHVTRALPDKLGSFAFDPDGNLLLALASGLFRYRMDTGQCDRLTSFEPELEAHAPERRALRPRRAFHRGRLSPGILQPCQLRRELRGRQCDATPDRQRRADQRHCLLARWLAHVLLRFRDAALLLV